VSISAVLIRRVNGTGLSREQQFRRIYPYSKTKGAATMRYMMIVKSAEHFGFPPKPLLDAIGTLSEEAVKASTMIGSGGLLATAQGARVKLSKGQVSVTDGPFSEAKEIIGGYAIFELPSKEEAIKGAVQFMELHKHHWPGWEGETEVRQMFGPDEMPCNAPERKS
jgi:hypothetical protein